MSSFTWDVLFIFYAFVHAAAIQMHVWLSAIIFFLMSVGQIGRAHV